MTRLVMRLTFPSGVFTTSVVSFGWLDAWPLVHRTVRRITRRMTRLPSALTVVVIFTLSVPSGDSADFVLETTSLCTIERRAFAWRGGVDLFAVVVVSTLGALRVDPCARSGLCTALAVDACCANAALAGGAAVAVAETAFAGNVRVDAPVLLRVSLLG